ncbi:MAG: glutathione S-transferase family protein, partial [Aquabacterium sp.]
MTDIVLHNYALSPFSEKIRTTLGLKRIAWRSVDV